MWGGFQHFSRVCLMLLFCYIYVSSVCNNVGPFPLWFPISFSLRLYGALCVCVCVCRPLLLLLLLLLLSLSLLLHPMCVSIGARFATVAIRRSCVGTVCARALFSFAIIRFQLHIFRSYRYTHKNKRGKKTKQRERERDCERFASGAIAVAVTVACQHFSSRTPRAPRAEHLIMEIKIELDFSCSTTTKSVRSV